MQLILKYIFLFWLLLTSFSIYGQQNVIDRVAGLEKDVARLKTAGVHGPEGDPGLQGPTGIQGVQGPQGAKGDSGPQGVQGLPGPKGERGPAGSGEQGPRGPQGIQGEQGLRGSQGVQGEQGPRGAAGISNEPGPKGERGLRGELGPPGPPAPVPTGNRSRMEGTSRIYNIEGKKIVDLSENASHHGDLKIYDKNETEKIYLGVNTAGEGMLKINGQTKDLAEAFEFSDRTAAIPGTIMAMCADGSGVQPANEAYDRKVVGVISEAGGLHPGLVLGSRADGSNDLPIALGGQVYVRICLDGGPIAVGDLLVASNCSGIAMKATDPMQAFGAVIGKALKPFSQKDIKENGEGLLLMLVMNH